jgi:hypothetical protein
LQEGFRAVMGVNDETIHADSQEMIHRIRNDGTPPDLQKRFRAMLRQGPKPRPQSRRQDKSRLKPSSVHKILTAEENE